MPSAVLALSNYARERHSAGVCEVIRVGEGGALDQSGEGRRQVETRIGAGNDEARTLLLAGPTLYRATRTGEREIQREPKEFKLEVRLRNYHFIPLLYSSY